jgi:ABC-type enterochelin transport system permease subunit
MQGWLLGDFSKIVQGNYEIIYLILPIVALTYLYAQRFTVLGMGEGMATSLGLNYGGTVALGLMLVAVTVAATVITVGAIPFVGLAIPNLVALRYGDNLGRTLPIVALGGASLLLACDIAGRLLIYPFEVPIGLTAGGVGGLLFLFLIIRGGDEADRQSADAVAGRRHSGAVFLCVAQTSMSRTSSPSAWRGWPPSPSAASAWPCPRSCSRPSRATAS